LILALDLPERDQALEMANVLKDVVGTFKIGLQLYTAYGPSIVEPILDLGGRVFLDLKFHDIPNTVGNAVAEACKLGVHMLTLHSSGGPSMLRRAREVADQHRNAGMAVPELLGVTVLTSLSDEETGAIGFADRVADLVPRLARLAAASGLDGIVCSPQELTRLQKEELGRLFFVTPGIRPAQAAVDDQKRVMSAGDAISAGARYLVVGRPILKAADPRVAAEQILEEIQSAMLK
jgi:orotidine-5'-phosphate decarboxylase